MEDEGSLCSTIGRTEEVKAKPLPLAKCATFYPVSGHFLGFGSASALLPLHLSARRGHHGPSSGPGRELSTLAAASAASPRPGHGRAHGSSAASAAGKLSRLAAATGPADAPARPGHGRAEGDAAPRTACPAPAAVHSGGDLQGLHLPPRAALISPKVRKPSLFSRSCLPWIQTKGDPPRRCFFFRHLIRSLRMK